MVWGLRVVRRPLEMAEEVRGHNGHVLRKAERPPSRQCRGPGQERRNRNHSGLCVLERQPTNNSSSNYFCAFSLAYHFGVKRIVLIGFDMQMKSGETNYHRQHEEMGFNKRRTEPDSAAKDYARFLRKEKVIFKDSQKLGLEVINCTPDSALTVFPFMDLKEAVENEKRPD